MDQFSHDQDRPAEILLAGRNRILNKVREMPDTAA
jgi:hypothetical protein